MKKLFGLLVMALLVIALSGCYFSEGVEQYERGLKLKGGVEIQQVLGAGRYTDLGFYSKLEQVSVSALKAEWEDPDLVTKDKQPIGLSVSVTFSRKGDNESVRAMWEQYNHEAQSDEALMNQVVARIPRAAKAVTTQFTLDEMLGVGEGGEEAGRGMVQDHLMALLSTELAEIYCDVKDVGINNISPDPEYLDLLKQKANAVVRREVAREEALTADETLKREQRQTEINVELARRDRLVQEEAARVFTANDRWFELKRLEAIQNIFSGTEKVWFIEPGVDLTLLFSGDKVVPLGQ